MDVGDLAPQDAQRTAVIDHVYISVTDLSEALTFCAAALATLGWQPFGA